MASAIRMDYPFLAHPPPQKKRPLQPLPSPPSSPISLQPAATCGPRRRSSTFSTIASWAAHVQPGSPASLSPRSPHRRPSLRKGRRPSIAPIRLPSVSFLHTALNPTTAFTPTPSVRDFKADLTTLGYTSVFLQLPNSPVSATLSLSIRPPTPNAVKNAQVLPVPCSTGKPRGFARFRSLSILRSRSRSKSACPNSPTKMKAKAAASSAAVVKRKKTKYAMRPPPLANELALMQFVDGGNTDDNIKRVMEAQAQASGTLGFATAYRDGEGGIWWDQDEEWEYTHLLAEGGEPRPHGAGDLQWVTFGGNSPSTASAPGADRRGSVSTQDSDLDPKYVVQPTTNSLDGDDLALFSSAVVPLTPHNPLMSALTLPSRRHPAAQHLRKPDLLVDAAFSRAHTSPKSPKSPTSSNVGVGMQLRGKARRRPAPLKLSPPSPALKRPMNSPIDADKARKDFLEASFEPTNLVPATPVTPATAVSATAYVDERRAIGVPWRIINDGLTTKRKPPVLNMMGLFRSSRKEDV